MKRLLRVLKAIAKTAVALLVLTAVGLLIARVVFTRQLNAEIAAIQERGDPLTMADLTGPEIPDSESAALIYIQVIDRLSADDFGGLIGDFTKRTDDPQAFDELRRAVGRHRDVMPLIKQALAMPGYVFQDEFRRLRIRRVAQFLRAQALVDAREGRVDEAIGCVETILKIAGVKSGHGLIPFIDYQSSIGVACRSVQEIAQYSDLTFWQAQRLQDSVAALDPKADFIRALKEDKAFFLATSSMQMSDWARWAAEEGCPTPPQRLLDPVSLVWLKVIVIGDQVAYVRLTDKLIGSLDMPYSAFQSQGFESAPDVPFYAILTRMSGPVKAGSFRGYCRTKAELAAGRVYLAVLAYENKYGSLPADLGELEDRLGWDMPTDPFNGEPLIYARADDGFKVYSVGTNLKDNGGLRKLPDSEDYDIVWEWSAHK